MSNAGKSGIPAVDLDEKSLLEEAVRNTGLSDYGDDDFRKGLHVLLSALEKEAKLSQFGRMFAHNEKAADILGWSPVLNLDEGLKKTIDWYRSYLDIMGRPDSVVAGLCERA